MSKVYQRTKSLFYVYDPIAEDYFKGMYRGVAQYTKFQWEANAYKTLQGAVAMRETLGQGYEVVDKDGKKYA